MKKKGGGVPKEPLQSKAKSHNDMYKPKGMSLKDGTVAAKTYSCDMSDTMFAKNEIIK